MVARIFMVTSIFFFAPTTFTIANTFDFTGKEDIELLNTRETKNCFVSLVKINNKVYLVKQKKDSRKQLAVVRDTLAAYIAFKLKIAHEVAIIPQKKNFPGKIKSDWPATLHTLAPGETVRAQRNSKYNALRLRQFWSGAKNIQEKGLTHSIISHMSWHNQLPIIVALDLILGNSDRHCGNLCYDPETDTFCAIDMDDTFNKDLCIFACKKIKMMIEDEKVIFTQKEIKALIIMRDTLKFLVAKHKPAHLIKQLHSFATKAGFVKGAAIYSVRIARKLRFYEQMIITNHASARKLISLLDTIITRKSCLSHLSHSQQEPNAK